MASQGESETFQERPLFKLNEMELWNQFNNLTTEMIITKSGRRMFPNLRINVKDLDPSSKYSILLEFLPTDNFRYKYSADGGWTSAEVAETGSTDSLIYIHPDSPARGEEWMSRPINFGRLKLTNVACSSHIVLSSMHKYQPRIVLQKLDKSKNVIRSTLKVFIETAFIAVTAYQNPEVTRLKIYNNPFAKGFRESSRSKKRKISQVQQSEDIGDNFGKEETITAANSTAFFIDNLANSNSGSITENQSAPNRRFHNAIAYFDGFIPHTDYNYHLYSHNRWFFSSRSINTLSPISVNSYRSLDEQTVTTFTDFSIKSILNLSN